MLNCPSTPSFAFRGACGNFERGAFAFFPFFRGPGGPSLFNDDDDEAGVGLAEVSFRGKKRELKSEMKDIESGELPKRS